MATKSCSYNTLYSSLCFAKGKPVLPGVRSHCYVIRKADIVSWPTRMKDPSELSAADPELGAYNDYTGNFTLAADKMFLRVDMIDNKGAISWETQGDKPARTILNKFTIAHPEVDGFAGSFQRMALTDDLVFLIIQRDGTVRVLGNEMFETDTKPAGGTGEGTGGGDYGSTFEIEVSDFGPAPRLLQSTNLPTTDGVMQTDLNGVISSATVNGSQQL